QPVSLPRAKEKHSDSVLFPFLSFCLPIRISELGPVHTPQGAGGRGPGRSSQAPLSSIQTGNRGSAFRKLGPRRNRKWDPEARVETSSASDRGGSVGKSRLPEAFRTPRLQIIFGTQPSANQPGTPNRDKRTNLGRKNQLIRLR